LPPFMVKVTASAVIWKIKQQVANRSAMKIAE